MKIEIGKRYWTRCGGISAIVRSYLCSRFPYEAGHVYTEDGSAVKGVEHPSDLVAEYTGPKLKMPMILEVGTRYVTKEGWVTTPVTSIGQDGGVDFRFNTHLRVLHLDYIEREYLGKDDPINKEIWELKGGKS